MTIFFYKELKEGFSGPYASWAETKVLIKKCLATAGLSSCLVLPVF